MRSRRLEHAEKDRFWEVYWEDLDAEVSTGACGTSGRSKRHEFATPHLCREFVEAEIAKRLKQGFIEVVPEAERMKAAPKLDVSREWLDRIAEAYDDDAPRLVFADHLMSQGDPLGDFIALQCERARLPENDPKVKSLREREQYLLDTYRDRWLPRVEGAELELRRGFIEAVKLEFPFVADKLAAVVAKAPLLRTLELVPGPSAYQGIGTPPWDFAPPVPALRQLTGLFIRGHRLINPSGEIRKLLEHPELARLDRLGLRSAGIDARAAELLVRRAWRELDLHDSVLGVRGMQFLVQHDGYVALDVGSSGITDRGANLIAKAPLTKLERLSLRRSDLTAASLALLLTSPHLGKLRALDLSANALDAAAVAALCAATLPALVELDLRDTRLGDGGITAFVRSPLAQRLVSLELGGCELTPAGIAALAGAELPALRYVSVSGNPIGDTGAQLKAALPHAKVIARQAKPAPAPDAPRTFTVGEQVDIIGGPFAHYTGTIEEVSALRKKLRVRVVVRGEPTTVEIDSGDV